MNDTLANGTNSFTLSDLALLTAINSIKLILGLPMDSYVLWLILNGAVGTVASELFYLNVIVSVILSSLPSVLYLLAAWLFTDNLILFDVTTFTFILLFLFSVPSFQCCVCVERYVAVVHPMVFHRYKALRYKVACCCAVWLTALVVMLFLAIPDTVHPTYFFLLGFWAVCISVVCYSCLAVLRALKQPGPGEGLRDTEEGNDPKRRAFRIILISLIVMSVSIISYIPTAVFTLLNYTDTITNTIASTIIMISALANPLLYLYKAGKLPCFKDL